MSSKIVRNEGGPWTRVELDHQPCPCGQEHPEHTRVGVGPTCHPPRTPMHATYDRSTGQLTLICAVCGTSAGVIQVAGAVPS